MEFRNVTCYEPCKREDGHDNTEDDRDNAHRKSEYILVAHAADHHQNHQHLKFNRRGASNDQVNWNESLSWAIINICGSCK